MSIGPKLSLAGGTLVCLMFLVLIWFQHLRLGTAMPEIYAEIPSIRLMLGDDFSTVQRQSSYQFTRTNLGKIDVVMIDKPFIFEYMRPNCRFILPPGRSFGAAVDNWHVTSVNVAPHLKYLSEASALELIQNNLMPLLGKSGWKLANDPSSLESIKREFDDPKTEDDHTIRAQNWSCGDDRLYVEIERHWKKDESLPKLAARPEDLYVVNIKLRNDKVNELYPGR